MVRRVFVRGNAVVGQVFAVVIGGVIVCAALAFPGAIVFQLCARVFSRERLDPDRCYGTSFWSALAMFGITFVLGMIYSRPLLEEADQARMEALRGYDTWHWSGEPEANGVDAYLGWGSTAPTHLNLYAISAILSIIAWLFILRARHRIDLGSGVLIVILTQIVWAVLLGILWAAWLGFRAIF